MRVIPDPTANICEGFLLILNFFQNFQFFQNFLTSDILPPRGITRAIVYRMSSDFAYLQLKPISPTYNFYIENEFRDFPGDPKIDLKVTVNCRPSITVFFVPGVLLTEGESPPLQGMWGGKVNRQPGYRARNLQRRGFLALGSFSKLTRDSPKNPG